MKTNTQQNNWLLDAALFGSFLVSFLLDLTGISLHQWLGLAVGIIAGYHLGRHWGWVQAVSQRFWGRTSRQARLYYLVDAGLFIGFSLMLLTGLVISTWLGFSLGNYTVWKNIHVLASIITLLLVVVKIGLHGRWILSIARRSIFPAPPPSLAGPQPRPVPVTAVSERRAFLKLMGVVGIASLVALGSALGGLEESQASEGVSTASTIGPTQELSNSSLNQVPSSSLASGCTARCPRGCSYPGHCRRYTDTNSNNLCDLGECA